MADGDDVFDVVVTGAGPVGETAAQRAIRGGLTAAVVERRLAGGECEYYGCIPSKALLWPMELAAAAGRMPGVELRGPIDAAAVTARRDEFVSHHDDSGQVRDVTNYPATFVRGQGRLAGPMRAEVTGPDGSVRALAADGPALRDTADDRGAPQSIFTDPEVCAAGRTEAPARADGFSVATVEVDIGAVPGAALQADGYTGRAKAVVDEDRHVLLGLTIVGPGVVDHLHAATVAVTAEVPLDRLWHAVPAFPTVSEFWLALLQEYGL